MIGIGINLWRRGGGSALAYYIDPSYAGGSPDGSYSAPWTDFTQVNALTGDLGGRIIRLKSGETIYDSLLLVNASNFTVETYDGSAPGIIDGSIPTGFTWTREGTTDFWYATSASQVAIYVGDIAYEMAQSAAVLSDSVFQRAQQTYYFGVSSVNAGLGSKMWVHVLPGVDMAAEEAAGRVRKPNADSYAFDMHNCSEQTLSNIQVQRGSVATLRATDQGDGFTATNCVFRQNGYYPGGQDLIDFSGPAASYATNTLFSGCTFEDNFGGTNNNATEFSRIDDLTIFNCTYNRILGNAVELWEDCHNATVDRCTFVDIGANIFWESNNAGGVHSNNTIQNCVSVSPGNSRSDNGSNTQGSVFVRSQSASNTKVYNNTHVTNALQGIIATPSSSAGPTNTITIKNNLFINSHDNGDTARIQTTGSVLGGDPAWTFVNTLTGAKNEIVSDYNSFYSYRQAAQSGIKMGNINGVATSGLAAWQAQTGTPDLHSYEVDQGVANPWGVPSGTTTTLTAGVSTGAWAIVVASLTGISVGTWVTVKLDSTTRSHTSRVASVDTATNTCNLECRFGSAAASGKLVTILSSPLAVLTPTNSPPLGSGIGNDTDANVPTVDFFGNPRSTSTPDIGAVEV